MRIYCCPGYPDKRLPCQQNDLTNWDSWKSLSTGHCQVQLKFSNYFTTMFKYLKIIVNKATEVSTNTFVVFTINIELSIKIGIQIVWKVSVALVVDFVYIGILNFHLVCFL